MSGANFDSSAAFSNAPSSKGGQVEEHCAERTFPLASTTTFKIIVVPSATRRAGSSGYVGLARKVARAFRSGTLNLGGSWAGAATADKTKRLRKKRNLFISLSDHFHQHSIGSDLFVDIHDEVLVHRLDLGEPRRKVAGRKLFVEKL